MMLTVVVALYKFTEPMMAEVLIVMVAKQGWCS